MVATCLPKSQHQYTFHITLLDFFFLMFCSFLTMLPTMSGFTLTIEWGHLLIHLKLSPLSSGNSITYWSEESTDKAAPSIFISPYLGILVKFLRPISLHKNGFQGLKQAQEQNQGLSPSSAQIEFVSLFFPSSFVCLSVCLFLSFATARPDP